MKTKKIGIFTIRTDVRMIRPICIRENIYVETLRKGNNRQREKRQRSPNVFQIRSIIWIFAIFFLQQNTVTYVRNSNWNHYIFRKKKNFLRTTMSFIFFYNLNPKLFVKKKIHRSLRKCREKTKRIL